MHIRELTAASFRAGFGILLSILTLFLLLAFLSQVPIMNTLVEAFGEWTPMTGIVLVVVVVIIYVDASITRFLARMLPLRADGRRQWALIAALAVAGVITATPALALFASFHEPTELFLIELIHPGYSKLTFQQQMKVGQGFFWSAIYLGVNLTYLATVPLFVLLIRHLRGVKVGDRLILFLRHFGGNEEKALLPAVLRSTPTGFRAAFIATPSHNAASWDPMAIVFSGMTFSRPWTAIPIYLRSSAYRWQGDIECWMLRSSMVVLDLSVRSPSIEAERELVKRLPPHIRCLTLARKGTSALCETAQDALSRSTVLEYALSWRRALPRILIVLGCGAAAGYTLVQFILYSPLGEASLRGYRELQLALSKHEVFVGLLIGAFFPMSFWLYPALDAGSARELKRVFRSLTQTRT